MKILRTPDERFANLPEYPFAPQYAEVPSGDGGTLRIHYLEEGPSEAAPVLLLHGEPSWSFLYRKIIPVLVAAGHRVVAPDLIGFGRSDKLASGEDYTYQLQVDWMASFLQALDLSRVTLFAQDWGGLIGLRLATDDPDRFDRIILANTGLPTGDSPPSEAFLQWQQFSQRADPLPIGRILQMGTLRELPAEVLTAYEAPFPDESYKAAARAFPLLVSTRPDDSTSEANRRAWQVLQHWDKPLLTLFSDSDPITARGDLPFRRAVPGAKGQPHTRIESAGHFLQEDQPEALVMHMLRFLLRSLSQ